MPLSSVSALPSLPAYPAAAAYPTVMLPPLRSSYSHPFTLSDCSDLSASSAPETRKSRQSKPRSRIGKPFKSAPKKVRSSKSNIPGESRYWTPSEHKLFVEALLKFGPKDLKSISAYVGTRNMIQCRTHEQKCFMRLMREAQRETMQRNGLDPDAVDENGKRIKPQKDVYSVSPSCGISLLCAVSDEMQRSLQS